MLGEYNNECNGIVHWDDNSTMLICTDGRPLLKYICELRIMICDVQVV